MPYTFIVPSLPGYGFSSGPSIERQSTCESMAHAIEQLMVGIGFGTGYVAQGGDIGSFVARILAARHSARAVHSIVVIEHTIMSILTLESVNFALMPPPDSVATEDIEQVELEGLGRAEVFATQGDAYAREQGQRPATIGLLLSTSPLALLTW
jgi:microsomal epoxide hydrolase